MSFALLLGPLAAAIESWEYWSPDPLHLSNIGSLAKLDSTTFDDFLVDH